MDPVCTADAGDGTASVSGLLVEFGEWLGRQRGLAPITIDNYCWNVEQFLGALPEPTRCQSVCSTPGPSPRSWSSTAGIAIRIR